MVWTRIKQWGNDLLRIIYPEVCEICGTSLVTGEKILCLNCDLNMPRTKVHNDNFNIIHQRLAGSTPINKAASYFYYYKESDYATLIHQAKYNNRPFIAYHLAQKFAKELNGSNFFDGIDIILPVPLHFLKLIKRGYNQSVAIAKGISAITAIPVGDNLYARQQHSTQTRKNSYERWVNAQGIYAVKNPEELANKHVLIIDDVITTGATLLACCNAIHQAEPTATISVLSLSVTHLQ